jgi:hypothetical protein
MRGAGWVVGALVMLAACDPIWELKGRVRDPSSRPVAEAVVVLGCPQDHRYQGSGPAVETDADGVTRIGGMGFYLPECDLFVLRPGYRTSRIPFAQLCPGGRERCERTAQFEVVLEPE